MSSHLRAIRSVTTEFFESVLAILVWIFRAKRRFALLSHEKMWTEDTMIYRTRIVCNGSFPAGPNAALFNVQGLGPNLQRFR